MKEAESSVNERLDRPGRDESKGIAEKQVVEWLDGQKQGNQTIGERWEWDGELLCH
jgi:hypothetical protein